MSPAPTAEPGRPRGCRPPIRARGFSLVEMVLVLGIAAVLLLGMGGALSMSMTALDKGRDRNAYAVSGASACDQVLADLNEATTITGRASTGVGFEVPDRDGDSAPDQISYAWSGTPGTPLYIAVNGGDPQAIVPGVEKFSIEWMTRSTPSAAGAEQVLATYDTSAGALLRTQAISKSTHAAQYVKPAFAANVESWTINRIQVRVARDLLATGTLRVSLVRSVNWQPTGQLLSKVDFAEGSLPAAATWFDVAVSAGPLLPTEGVFIKLEDVALIGLGVGTVEYGSGGTTMPYNTFFTTSSDSGATWSGPQDTKDMRFVVYGTMTTH